MNLKDFHVFATVWNDQFNLDMFLEHYGNRVGKITVYDNMSDVPPLIHQDLYSASIELKIFDTDGEMDEYALMNLRNECWWDSPLSYCIVVDCDELVDLDQLEKIEEFDYIITTGYEMCSLTQGVPTVGYNKPVIFRNHALIHTNYQAGSHTWLPQFSVTPIQGPSVNLYHMKWAYGWQAGIERQKLLATRVAKSNLDAGMNFHYGLSEEVHLDYYTNLVNNSTTVR